MYTTFKFKSLFEKELENRGPLNGQWSENWSDRHAAGPKTSGFFPFNL